MPPDHQRLDLNSARGEIENLFEQVLSRKARVEVTRGEESCVLISKTELDSLEQALEILADGENAHAMQELVSRLAAQETAVAPVATA